jgi:hypothetical protein
MVGTGTASTIDGSADVIDAAVAADYGRID